MKTEDKNQEFNINDVTISVDVNSEVLEQVLDGRATHMCLSLTDENQGLFLESIEGALALVLDELPETYHGCYLYNNGEFPYAIKSTLNYIILSDGKETGLVRIIGINTVPGTRFRFQGPDEPSVEDSNGDSCIWELQFEVVPVPADPRHYLLRWNPSVSSFKDKDYKECVANQVHGMFRLNWSIYEWQEARRGDYFYMLRTGDDKTGIVFRGQFLSDPYPADDWSGTTKRRMYVDLVCEYPVEPGAKPSLSLKELQKALPEYEWTKGHSGVLLSYDVAVKLECLCNLY